MQNDQIAFAGDGSWLVVDLYRFFRYLNVFYNRLYVLKKHEKAVKRFPFHK
jgi:hypothetical protein